VARSSQANRGGPEAIAFDSTTSASKRTRPAKSVAEQAGRIKAAASAARPSYAHDVGGADFQSGGPRMDQVEAAAPHRDDTRAICKPSLPQEGADDAAEEIEGRTQGDRSAASPVRSEEIPPLQDDTPQRRKRCERPRALLSDRDAYAAV